MKLTIYIDLTADTVSLQLPDSFINNLTDQLEGVVASKLPHLSDVNLEYAGIEANWENGNLLWELSYTSGNDGDGEHEVELNFEPVKKATRKRKTT